MAGEAPLLEVRDLTVSLATEAGRITPVRGASLTLREGERMALVGESGCGKSTFALSLLRLLPPGARITGSVKLRGRELIGVGKEAMRDLRGRELAMIFQDPMTAFNPVLKIGAQIAEALDAHRYTNGRETERRVVKLLDTVGLPNPEAVAKQYPHQLSGGMRQRAMMAMAFACDPKLILADEPTSALDVTLQAQALRVMRGLAQEFGSAVILITHDLSVVRQLCQRIVVMYAGLMVEDGPIDQVMSRPAHPYTKALLGSVPQPDAPSKMRLPTIPGQPPNFLSLPTGCPFRPRCPLAIAECEKEPPFIETQPGHWGRCFRAKEVV